MPRGLHQVLLRWFRTSLVGMMYLECHRADFQVQGVQFHLAEELKNEKELISSTAATITAIIWL